MKLKAFKFKLIPNTKQKIQISKTIGCSRFLYNQMLNEKIEKHKNNDQSPTKTEKQYKQEFNFLKDVDSVALQQSRLDLYNAYQNHFRKLKTKQKSNLKFKSKKNPKNSYRTINTRNTIRIKKNKIKLPKLGWINFYKSQEVNGNIKSVTVSKNILGQYFVSVLCETEIKEKPKNENIIALDLGVKDFLTDSNGDKVKNPRNTKKLEKKLKKEQKILSGRVKDSKRKFKQRKKVFKVHQKIANRRSDFLQKLSTKIISENQVIILEDLGVKDLIEKKDCSKSICDASWSKFVNMLEYKADWYGREIVKVDKYFPSSKLCNCCGWKKEDLTLKDRTWKCENCLIIHDRDINAGKNLLEEGLRISNKNRRDDEVSSVNKCALAHCS